MTVSLGVHVGQQAASMAELRSLWRRLDDAGVDWISVWDHLYEAPPAGGTVDHFEALSTLGRAGRRHQPGPHRLPRVLRPVPEPGTAGEGGHDARPHLRGPLRAGPRRGVARARGRGVRVRLPAGGPAPRPARGGAAADPQPPHPGPHDPQRRALPHRRRVVPAPPRCRSGCRSGSGAPGRSARCGSPRSTPTAGTPPTSAPIATASSTPSPTGGARPRGGTRRPCVGAST